MDKLVVLKIEETNPEQDLKVTVEIGNEGHLPSEVLIGNLPHNTSIFQNNENWRTTYKKLGFAWRLGAPQGQLTNYSEKDIILLKNECSKSFKELKTSLNNWLQTPDFSRINERLRTKINPKDRVRFLIKTTNKTRELPWYLWDFFKDYSNAEPAISSVTYQTPTPRKLQPKKVKILAIIGNSTGIDTKKDKLYLKQLPNAEVEFLVEPKPSEISDKLWEQQWDIIFFAGHSKTEQEKGIIYLNKTDSLTIEELKNSLEKAINNGLQIAIFNSCDGLGLAWELEKLNIPQVIVMREPVPDLVAQEFLKYFLKAFSNNTSLYLAVKQAKKRLEENGWNKQLPGSILLPVIYQNPGVIPPTWNELAGNKQPLPPTKKGLLTGVITSAVCTGIVGIIRTTALIQGGELSAYDHLMRWRPHSPLVIDERILVVTIDEADIQYQRQQNWSKNPGTSLSDEALNQLLTQLEKVKPKVIGLDIYHQHPFEPKILNRLNKNYPFYVICKTHSPESQDTQPPKNIPPEFVGFSDVVVDSDGVVRRQLMSMQPQPTDPCNTDLSLNSLMAFYYLDTLGIEVKAEEKGWVIGNRLLPKLTNHAGGYQQLDSRGSQILLNYRYYKSTTEVAASVSLKDVLTNSISGEYPIILIGVTAGGERYNDYFLTPYGEEIPGVFLQAQMISQIISSVEESQPVIWWLPVHLEIIWIWGWSLVTGIVVYYIREPLRSIIAQVIIFSGLGVSCWLIFATAGGWFPLVSPFIALNTTTIIVLILRRVTSCRVR